MSKKQTEKSCSKSIFTLTFVVEVTGFELCEDSQENWIPIEACTQGVSLQYQLYFGEVFDINISIWQQVAKVQYGQQSTWVRTWRFLERRFLAFTISHVIPVRVVELKQFAATVYATRGASAAGTKGDTLTSVYLPKLQFGDLRYFAPVLTTLDAEPLSEYIWHLLWEQVIEFIPKSIFDGVFDTPQPVQDRRHQDTSLYYVKEALLNKSYPEEEEEKDPKLAKKSAGNKYGLFLSGDRILAGVGRIIPFLAVGDNPVDVGEVYAFLSTENIPANDDLPVMFVNIENLFNTPLETFIEHGVTHLYTRWVIGEDEHVSEYKKLNIPYDKNEPSIINIDDHCALTLEVNANKIITNFLDDPFEIELRGLLNPEIQTHVMKPKFFGYEKNDKAFGTAVAPKLKEIDLDIAIARTRINARAIGKGLNEFMRGEYPLFPPELMIHKKIREDICTNDINAIGLEKDKSVVPSSLILEYEMSLEVSMGLVGCRPRPVIDCYTRIFILSENADISMKIIREIWQINEDVAIAGPNDHFLSGFAIDTGDVVLFYIEGPRDGYILRIWEITRDYVFNVKPFFSSFAKYTSRVYPELCVAVPFVVLKMYVPIAVFLACPPAYVRPNIPLPAKSAALKLGRLIASKFYLSPCRADLPSSTELKSFRLELCAPPRPPPVPQPEKREYAQDDKRCSVQTIVNWSDNNPDTAKNS